jgi:C1A family cysteine protease
MKIPLIVLLIALAATTLADGSLTAAPLTSTTPDSLVGGVVQPYQGHISFNFTVFSSGINAGNLNVRQIPGPFSLAGTTMIGGSMNNQHEIPGNISDNSNRLTRTPRIFLAQFSDDYRRWSAHPQAWNKTGDMPGHGLGLIPAPVNFNYATVMESAGNTQVTSAGVTPVANTEGGSTSGRTQTGVVTASGIASSYDLRTLGKLTPVKDQGQDGNCWAFAAIGSLESSLLPGASTDLSENNMKNRAGFDTGPNDGGNDFMASAYLARWGGPVSDSDDPYSSGSVFSLTSLPVEYHVQEIFFIPARSGYLSNDRIKDAITQYGAVYSTLRFESSSYNPGTAAYYYQGSDSANHAIDLVGWDDNYDRTKFATPAPGNGAFIARNSWGSGWGDGGYFYISYYDNRIGTDNALFTAQSSNNYNHIYQYDPLGWVANFGFGTDTAYYANVFSSSGNENLEAVSFYTTATNAEYELKVYKDPDNGPIASSGYSLAQSGSFALPGYHTVVLEDPVSLKSGETFSVVVKMYTAGWNSPVAIEYPITGYSSGATASSGQSYISSDGNSWDDLTGSLQNTNVCLKAFTVSGTGQSTSVPSSSGSTLTMNTTSTANLLKKLTNGYSQSIKVTSARTYMMSNPEFPGNVTFSGLTANSYSPEVVQTGKYQSTADIMRNLIKPGPEPS